MVYESNYKVKQVKNTVLGGDMASLRLALSRVILLYISNLDFPTLVAKENKEQYLRLGHPDVI